MAYTNRGAVYRRLGQHDEALADYDRAIQLDATDSIAYRNRGNLLLNQEQYEKALADYYEAIRLDPGDAIACLHAGISLTELGRLRGSLRYFDRASALGAPDGARYGASVRLSIGTEFADDGDFEEALRYFEEAAQLGDPRGAEWATTARMELSFRALQLANSEREVGEIVSEYPLMTDQRYIEDIEQLISQDVPADARPYLNQRLTWLRRIAVRKPRR